MSPLPCLRFLGLPVLLAISACSTLPPPSSMPAPPGRHPALDRELQALTTDPQAPVVGVAALAIRDGQVVYSGSFGHRHLAEPALPLDEHTLVRVASISKLVVALGVLRLVEQGSLALDDDVSVLLGWRLRHPQFPDDAITLRRLLSHRSGLSDNGEAYFFDAGTRLQDVLAGPGPHWQDGHRPGARFQYVNLNYGVVATVMERATGERFDRLMQRLVLHPLGLRGGFNPAEFPPQDRANLAALYRKRHGEGAQERWDPAGPWVLQADDFRTRPAQALPGLDRYRIGDNGSLFGPQGRLRISLRDLGVLMQMLLNVGLHQGQVFLQPASVAQLGQAEWTLAEDRHNGNPSRDWAWSWGLGAQRFTDRSGSAGLPGSGDRLVEARGDRLVEGGGFSAWGHLGDAYGLMGLFALDPATRRGMVLLVMGPGVDPARYPSRYSALYRWQEIGASAIWRHVLR